MTPRKKQHNRWDRELSRYLEKIKTCEVCRLRPGTDKAHRLKRRFIGWRTWLDKLEYFMAAKVCRACHTGLDEHTGPAGHERMFMTVTRVVMNRHKKQLTGEPVPCHPLTTWQPELIYTYDRREET